MKKKRIVAIGRQGPTFDQLIINPDFCPHENRGWQTVGGQLLKSGQVDDDIQEVFYCLDCGAELKPEPVNSEPYEPDEVTRLWISGGE